jgi:hypothetical protein
MNKGKKEATIVERRPDGSTRYQTGKYAVTVGTDASILVRKNDWLSKYSYAMHGDFKHIGDFVRLNPEFTPRPEIPRQNGGPAGAQVANAKLPMGLPGGRTWANPGPARRPHQGPPDGLVPISMTPIRPIKNKNLILTGELLYYLPDYLKLHPETRIDPAPEKEEVKVIEEEVADWLKQNGGNPEHTDVIAKGIVVIQKALEWCEPASVILNILGAHALTHGVVGVGLEIGGVAAAFLIPAAFALEIIEAADTHYELLEALAYGYAVTAWVFDQPMPSPSVKAMAKIESACAAFAREAQRDPRNERSVRRAKEYEADAARYRAKWNKRVKETTENYDTMVRTHQAERNRLLKTEFAFEQVKKVIQAYLLTKAATLGDSSEQDSKRRLCAYLLANYPEELQKKGRAGCVTLWEQEYKGLLYDD